MAASSDDFDAADDRVGHAAARFARRERQLGEEIPVQRLAAVVDQIAQDENRAATVTNGTHAGQREHHVVDSLAPE